MQEFIRVDPAPIWPHRCVACLSYRALADSHVEIEQYGRVYVCKLCASRFARVFGLVKGDEQTVLMNADTRLTQLEKQLVDSDQRREEAYGNLPAAEIQIAELEAELEHATGRLTQLTETMRAKATEELALVGSAYANSSYPSTTTSGHIREEHHEQGQENHDGDPEDEGGGAEG
jgi:hypothetical protein